MLPRIGTILCAVDLGRTAPSVLRYALSLARAYGGSVIVVYAVEPLGPAARHMVELYAHEETTPQLEEARWLQVRQAQLERLRRLCDAEPCRDEAGRDLVADIRVLRGKPAEAILQESRRIASDAIVIGSHGHSAVGEILLGSTAHKVAQKAAVPVLLVRGEEGSGGQTG
jgi:nucleotide-binding universal stress UspA family protein